jgi:hypothetical protein
MDDQHADKRLERIENIPEAITKQIDVLARATSMAFAIFIIPSITASSV